MKLTQHPSDVIHIWNVFATAQIRRTKLEAKIFSPQYSMDMWVSRLPDVAWFVDAQWCFVVTVKNWFKVQHAVLLVILKFYIQLMLSTVRVWFSSEVFTLLLTYWTKNSINKTYHGRPFRHKRDSMCRFLHSCKLNRLKIFKLMFIRYAEETNVQEIQYFWSQNMAMDERKKTVTSCKF
jgi:hypothetical protein